MSDDLNYEYLKSEIPIELINECELLASQNNETYFIFDKITTDRILLANTNKEDERDIKINNILYEGDFHIGTSDSFNSLPSRYSYYDTNIRIVDRYKRYDYVIDYIKKIGFLPSEWNLGRELEQSFSIFYEDNRYYWELRLMPNMIIYIKYSDNLKYFKKPIYSEFFNEGKILAALEESNKDFFRSIVRDMKIDSILL